MSRFSQERYVEALRFAAVHHQGQRWPGSELPYVIHVCMVAMEVIAALDAEDVEDPDLAVTCALLHDTIEDTAATYEQIADRFGDSVAEGVAALSKDAQLPKADQMPDSLRRLQASRREVQLVKLADRITNLAEPPAHWTDDKKRAYRTEAETIVEALGPSSRYLRSRLSARISDYGQYIG